MKRLSFVVAVAVLIIPMYRPMHSQDGGFGGGFGGDAIDLSGLLGGDRGGRGGPGFGGRGGFQIPDSKTMFQDIQSTLKKGKTSLEKQQEKPLQSLLDKEIVALTDRIQLLRTNASNNNAGFPASNFPGGGPGGNFPGGFPGGDFPGGFPGGGNIPADQGGGNGGRGNQGGPPANNPQAAQPANALAIQMDTITSLKNEDFLTTKLSLFLSPEQVALVQKAHAADKTNASCLGGLLDRYSTQLQNPGRGNNNQSRGSNNSASNESKPNGQKYCMTQDATPSDRLEPIRKVLAKGNLPLAKDKEGLAEIVMKSELQDLEVAMRAGLTGGNNGGGRGGGINNNRNNNPQQIIQSSTDNMYKKVEAMLNPPQAETLKKWQYTQMLDRGGIETLIAVEAMQDTPLTDDQVTKVTAAWPELRTQLQQAARQTNKSVSQRDIDNAAMIKILDMLEPAQVASYQLAKKYGPQAAAGK